MKENRLTKTGLVVSSNMNKTVVVRVETLKQHPLYKKTLRHRVKFKAHDENSSCKAGDLVKIVQTRPLSKTKRWQIAEILRHGELLETVPIEEELKPKEELEEPKEEHDTASDQTEGSG